MERDIIMQQIAMIGNEIKEARKAKNLTQVKVAEEVGVRPTDISLIERGKKAPSLELLVKICNVLKTQVRIVDVE